MKSAVEGYDQSPFYFRDNDEKFPRWIAWSSDPKMHRETFFRLLEAIGDRIDYMLKEDDGYSENSRNWVRSLGGIYRTDLVEVINRHKRWFFKSSGFQFCARRADEDDYFAYDDHGIFWIYSNETAFEEILEACGYENRQEDLICDRPHWQVHVEDSEEKAKKFKSALIELSVYTDDRS